MSLLVVPMDPSFLPELALLIASLFAGGAAVYFVSTRRFGRAARAGAASLASAALVVVLAKTTHQPAGPPVLSPATANSMSLVLGDVVLRVAPSDRYALSVDQKPFLDLDLRRKGLSVTGVVGANDHPVAGLLANTFPKRWADARPSSPDAHTLVLTDEGRDIFRVRYSEPGRIEVRGQFFEGRAAAPSLISFEKGIRWGGGGIAPGTVIDLRDQGPGRIDFGASGDIRILPAS